MKRKLFDWGAAVLLVTLIYLEIGWNGVKEWNLGRGVSR